MQGITPHINLLVENTKDEWDKSKLHHFFAKELPRDLAKCVAQRKSVKVTDINSSGIFGYINKIWKINYLIIKFIFSIFIHCLTFTYI